MKNIITILVIIFITHLQTCEENNEANNANENKKEVNISGITIDTIMFLKKKYVVCEVNPEKANIELFNQINEVRVYTFKSIHDQKKEAKEKLIFAMNAGMYNKNLRPIGLFVSKGEIINSINVQKKGYGNFYDLQPNGVFAVDIKNKAFVTTTDNYKKISSKHKIETATQSGPMLVIDSVFNAFFNKGSKNLNIRNGVGVNEKGNVVFVISKDRVNFYEFSQLFRDSLNCYNALYLDGFVSEYYIPRKHEPKIKHQLGPIIAVSKK